MVKKSKKKKAAPKRKSMSKRQFMAALDQLGLTIAGKPTSRALGLGVRQCMRMGHGKVPVPRPVELLLDMYLQHGLRDDV